MYRLTLSDNSFMYVNDMDTLKVYPRNPLMRPKKIAVLELVGHEQLYWLVDQYDNVRIKRGFILEPCEETSLPTGMRFKYAQHIRVGDLLIGDDGKPTQVDDLHRGEDDLYEIDIDDNKVVVNGGHILHLINRDSGEELDLPVNIYVQMDETFKQTYVMYNVQTTQVEEVSNV